MRPLTKQLQLCFRILLIIFLSSCSGNTIEFFVSPSGSDSNPGTKNKPFQSFQKAEKAVSGVISDGMENNTIHIYFRGGRYFFDHTVVLKGDNYKIGNNRIVFSSYKNEKPVFSPGQLLDGWSRVEHDISYLPETAQGNIWEICVPDSILGSLPRFLCNDTSSFPLALSGELFTAEADDINETTEEFDSDLPSEVLSCFVYPDQSLREWDNIYDIEIVTRPHYAWALNILPLKTIDIKENIAFTTIPATYKICRIYFEEYIPNLQVQNAIDYLDEPGEWVINSVKKKIYYWPESGIPENVYCPLLQEIIRVEGNEKDGCLLKNIEFRGITFAHGNRDTWDQNTIGLQHDWAIYNKSDALLRFIDSDACIVDNCTFTTSGGGGIRFDFYGQNNKVINCKFSKLGGTAILLAGYGPGHRNVNGNNEILNNEIHDCGQIYSHSPAVFIWQSGGNRVAHNLIYNMPYSGIVISGPRFRFFNKNLFGNRRELSGTFDYDEIDDTLWKDWDKLFPYLFAKDNIIELNELHHTVQKMGDGNHIYLSGTGDNNIIRRNYVHNNTSDCRQGAIRCDDSAKGQTITENIIYRFASGGIVFKNTTTVTNNYIIDYIPTERANGERHYMHSFIWLEVLGSLKGSIIKRNILYQSAGLSEPFIDASFDPADLIELDELPKLSDCDIDSNLYFTTGLPFNSLEQLQELKQQGLDSNSLAVDPCFEGLEEAGFMLQGTSPAIKLGIKQIEFKNIGLQTNFSSLSTAANR